MDVSGRFFERAKKFVCRNARPLDFARWKFHFEGGGKEELLSVLAAYQNPDGGFGHAVEPDLWTPESTSAGGFAAAEILREAEAPAEHPLVQGLLGYLESGKDFARDKWLYAAADRAYPHAAWCGYGEGGKAPALNYSARFAAFILKYAKRGGSLYRVGRGIAVKCIFEFFVQKPKDAETLKCYLELLGASAGIPEFGVIDMEYFRQSLFLEIRSAAERQETAEKQKAAVGQRAEPNLLRFYDGGGLVFEIFDEARLKAEAEAIMKSQLADGSLPFGGKWWTDFKQAEIAGNWYKAAQLITVLRFIKSI